MGQNLLLPMDPLPAATLILVREHDGGIQAQLLLRGAGAAFMSGKYVFPGGKVDSVDGDFDFWSDHVDLEDSDIESRFGDGLLIQDALAFGVTAIRETLEEAGVFLAQGTASRKEDTDRVCTLRLHDNAGKNWFKDEAASGGWSLSLSQLFRWSHWITPERMKPRFDTRFFLAFMPADQVCKPDLKEIARGIWISPRQALEKNQTGDIPLSPPTLVTLQELLSYPTAFDLKAECRRRKWGRALLPRLVPVEGGGVILEPWDKDYEDMKASFEFKSLEKSLLPAGAPFSKIWYNGTVWRPVKA